MEIEKPIALTRLEEMVQEGRIADDHFPPEHPLAFINGADLYNTPPAQMRELATKFMTASVAFLENQEAYTTCLMTMMRLYAAADMREHAGIPDHMDIRDFFNRLGPSSESVN